MKQLYVYEQLYILTYLTTYLITYLLHGQVIIWKANVTQHVRQ